MTSVRAVVRWPIGQIRGFAANVRDLLTTTKPSDLLPPWIVDTIGWFKAQVPRAAGFGTPAQQMVASVVLAIAMIVSSFGLLTPLAATMLVPFLVGAARLWPVVDDVWPLTDTP